MADVGVFEISADLATVASSSLAASLYASGNVNVRRVPQKRLYERLLVGAALRSEVGEAPKTAIVGFDPPFVVSSSVFTYPEQEATAPSWTQHNVGKEHAFVIPVLSSSDHEVSRLNAYASGQLPLEESPVPASASSYYSKANRLVYRAYKLSASIDLPVDPPSIERFPFDQEITVPRPVFDSTSGSYRAYSYFNPAIFEIDIPDYGKIRDIRVWVEFIHDVRGHTGSIGTSGAYTRQGLGNVQVALRSPNVTFRSAHPFWNDPQTFGFKHRPVGNLTGSANQFGDQRYHFMPELLKNSYLLWAGHSLDGDDIGDVYAGFESAYVSWNNDIDMRTVFWDAAPQSNTRHLDRLFAQANENGPGNPAHTGSAVSVLSGGAPNERAFSLNPTSVFFDVPSARGKGVPWIIDSRIQTGSSGGGVFSGLRSGDSLSAVLGTSPPRGWLTGPGGTAGPGEFPTTGSNLGPDTIRPVYPLLDDLFVERKYDETPDLAGVPFVIPTNHPKMVGFRPGLRGTEIHGRWQLLVGMGAEFDPVTGMVAHPRSGVWFRQLRLEFIVDERPDPEGFYPSKTRRFERPAYVPQIPGKRRVHIVSGSSAWDIGINYVQTEVKPDYGRSVGITDSTGSSPDSFAVLTRLTGTLADFLTGSGQGALHAYLRNEFGTPYIPISSGSGIAPSFNTFDVEEARASRDLVNEVLRPVHAVPQANTLQAHINRAKVVKSRRDTVFNRIGLLTKFGYVSGSRF